MIVFSRHAKEKFKVLARHGLSISESEVKEAITEPDSVETGKKSRFIAQKAIDERHVLRVIYEKKENKIHSIPRGGGDMRISYDKEVDVLMVEFSEEKIEYAEEMDPMIVHFTSEGKPVLVEILDASEFMAEVERVLKERGQKRR